MLGAHTTYNLIQRRSHPRPYQLQSLAGRYRPANDDTVTTVPDMHLVNTDMHSDRVPTTPPQLDTVPIVPDTHMANTYVPSDLMPTTSPQIDQGFASMIVPAPQAPIEHIHPGPMDLAETTPAALPPGNAHYVSHQVAPQQPPDFSGIMDTGADKHVTGTDAPTHAFSHYVPSLVKICIANGDITSPSAT